MLLVLAVTTAGLTACGRTSPSSTAPATTATTAAAPTTLPATTLPPATTPPIPADAGQWSLVPNGRPDPAPPAAWTGHELVVSEGGCCGALGSVDLYGYTPATGTWTELPDTPLTARSGAVGTWTGTEMIVAGGVTSPDGSVSSELAPATDGAAWTAATNSWHRIAPMPVPLPANGFETAVWTGREMLVWASRASGVGGLGETIPGVEVALAYDPATDRWRQLPTSGLTPREDPVVVWTGSELVVWGGLSYQWRSAYGDGARLDPTTGTWRRLPPAPVPARGQAAAVWSGHEVLIWGGATGPTATSQVGMGAAYSPSTNTWRALPLSPLRAKSMPAGVWTGRLFIVLGGAAGPTMPVPGPGAAAYDPASNTWTALPASPAYPATGSEPAGPAAQRAGAIGVWTGSSALFVGGLDFRRQGARSDGLMWTPAS